MLIRKLIVSWLRLVGSHMHRVEDSSTFSGLTWAHENLTTVAMDVESRLLSSRCSRQTCAQSTHLPHVSLVQEGASTSAAVTFLEMSLAGGSASVGCSDVMFTHRLHPPSVIAIRLCIFCSLEYSWSKKKKPLCCRLLSDLTNFIFTV